jgi:acetyl-CoA carboxylase biotin carboxylase subunit
MADERTIKRVLVANRGEIAVRVMRTCRERGIQTVAVYSEVDRLARHVLFADRAVAIGPASASESYLVIDKILDAARQSGADAIHPGYGFLSENAEFADACEEAGITFIGPRGDSMRKMGTKTRARAAVMAAGAPVVPGNNGPDGGGFPDSDSALAAAREIGFPIMIKAASGGGGKGMRLVHEEKAFVAAFDGARREGASSFGDDTVYLEKAIIRPRHVEVQIFADQHGNYVHLGERDCSVQRRHQKVIEESPSPVVSAELRARMGESAIKAAKACDYRGAGTVEFLLGADGNYYFLEMNTRLQVEHPVTELLYGVDLVSWQLDVAAGKTLPMTQDQLDARRRGAAIECRVYAEDPVKFLPSPGTITRLRVPDGPYVRDDSGTYEGATIPVHYDPLISKLIVWGGDRDEALARMRRALDEYLVSGIQTNLSFHRKVMRHAGFCAGEYDTGFIGREQESLLGGAEADGSSLDAAIAAAAIEVALESGVRVGADETGNGGNGRAGISAWRAGASGWRR